MKARHWIAAAGIASGLFVAGSVSAYIYPNAVNDFTYYADAAKTTPVGGERIYACPGDFQQQSWGERTPYRTHTTWPCPGAPDN